MTTIIESGMPFDFADQTGFRLEDSDTHKAVQPGVKIADFLYLCKNDTVVWCVEAKSSSPHPNTQPDFEEFISDVKNQLLNAFSLYFAMRLDRHATAGELPPTFKIPELARVGIQFVLIIAGHPQDWLPPLKEALYKELYPTIRTWNLGSNPVIVLNDELAREYRLIR